MTTPNNKVTRFEDRTEIFQYSNKDDDWLLASPQINPNNRKQTRQNLNPPQHQIQVFRPSETDELKPEDIQDDPEIANLMEYYKDKQNSTAEKKKNQERENEMKAERAERAERERQEEMRKAIEAEELRALEEARRQEQLRLEKQEMERQREVQRERMKAQLKLIPPPIQQMAQNAPKKSERVTISACDWFKMTIGQPPLIKEQLNNVEKPRNSMRGNRVTLDLKAVSSMFSENYNKYEAISNKRLTLSRKSLSYRNSTNPSAAAFDRYFQSLGAEQTEAELAEEKFFADLEEQSGRRLRESEIKIAKLQQQVRELQAELASIPDQPEQIPMSLEKFQQYLEPFKKFYYNLRIQIMKIETSQLDPYTIYCEFILDQDLFFKLRREDITKPAEILTMHNALRDVIPGDILIDLPSKIEILRLYFDAKLNKLPSYNLLEQLGLYYGQLKQLEDDLARLSSFFGVRSMEMSRTYEKLTFELTIHPNKTVLVTLKLLELMDPHYYEFYHIETSRDIFIDEQKLLGDDLIDIIQAMMESI